jgi:hypothetical protein
MFCGVSVQFEFGGGPTSKKEVLFGWYFKAIPVDQTRTLSFTEASQGTSEQFIHIDQSG